MVLKLSKKSAFFCKFVLTSARNLSLLKQSTYMLLKVLITLFQKMIWFIGVCATVHEMLAIMILKKMLIHLSDAYIYINCFNRLRYLAAVSTELQKKSTFLENLRTIILEGNMETRQVTPFFIYFFRLKCSFIYEFENTQNSFSCGPPFGQFWSVKYVSFWPKATDSESSSYFSRQ